MQMLEWLAYCCVQHGLIDEEVVLQSDMRSDLMHKIDSLVAEGKPVSFAVYRKEP